MKKSKRIKLSVFLKHATFFPDTPPRQACRFVRRKADMRFGNGFVMYSFRLPGCHAAFIVDEQEGRISAEQIEIRRPQKIRSKALRAVLNLKKLVRGKYRKNIAALYRADGETVSFLSNGLNLHYHRSGKKHLPSLIIGPHEASRELVRNTMRPLLLKRVFGKNGKAV